jgi:penicillin-binding protein activator
MTMINFKKNTNSFIHEEETMKRFAQTSLALASLCLLVIVAGCTTKVTRVTTDSTIDLSGKWNDADSRLVAEEMIKDCLGQRWLYKWESVNKRPTVIIGKIKNESHEHINTQTFTKDLERSLLNSGKVDFVANKSERDQIRDEKEDQAQNASAKTAKSSHEEMGADLMLIGSINTIVDQEGSRAVLFYQTNMELVDVESHQKVWIGEKKIKKFVERATTSF